QSALERNLDDAGCSAADRQRFLDFFACGRAECAISLLRGHRARLLDDLHAAQKKIDALDFLLFSLRQEEQAGSGRQDGPGHGGRQEGARRAPGRRA
ncbi:MAG: hypothetical protein Q4F72_00955, partial [Desulfovibrionaceae bacterium]|nr:hypothetical protein [Desulfovibrionaceae bacterium]